MARAAWSKTEPNRAAISCRMAARSAAPLPDLPITQRVSIALPDAGYTVTVERYRPAETGAGP